MKGCFLLSVEFVDIKVDLDFSASTRTQNEYEIIIFGPEDQKHVLEKQESEKVYLFKSHRVQQNCIRVKCRRTASEV